MPKQKYNRGGTGLSLTKINICAIMKEYNQTDTARLYHLKKSPDPEVRPGTPQGGKGVVMNSYFYEKTFTFLQDALFEIGTCFEAFEALGEINNLEDLIASPLIFTFRWNEGGDRWEAHGYTSEGKEYIFIVGHYDEEDVEVLLGLYAEETPDFPMGWTSAATPTCGRPVDLRDVCISREVAQLCLGLRWRYNTRGCTSFYADLDPRPALWAIWGYDGPNTEEVITTVLGVVMAELRHNRPSFRHVPVEEMARLRAYALAYYNALQAVATACITRLGIFAEGDSLTFKREVDEIVAE